MKIILDEREHALYEKCQILIQGEQSRSTLSLSKEVLHLGDILIRDDNDKTLLIIERKSFADLLASIKDGRYEEQSYRLLRSSEMPPHSIIYVLEGMFSQLRFPNDKKIIYSAMTSLMFFKGFSVHRTATIQETAEWLLHLTEKIGKEMVKNREPYYKSEYYLATTQTPTIATTTTTTTTTPPSMSEDGEATAVDMIDPIDTFITTTAADYCSVVKKVKKDNITPANIGEIILCQIPGISSITAIAIMTKFNKGFPHFLKELQDNPTCLDNIYIDIGGGKQRKISKSSIENIKRFLLATLKPDVIPEEKEPDQL